MKFNCDCEWTEQPNQSGSVKGYNLTTECILCKTKREEANAVEAARVSEATRIANLPENKFDVIVFQTDLQNALPTLSNLNLRWEFGALNTYATNRDFEGLAWYVNMLYAGAVATEGDVAVIMSLLSKQGLILE
jgi:hypothetical protein